MRPAAMLTKVEEPKRATRLPNALSSGGERTQSLFQTQGIMRKREIVQKLVEISTKLKTHDKALQSLLQRHSLVAVQPASKQGMTMAQPMPQLARIPETVPQVQGTRTAWEGRVGSRMEGVEAMLSKVQEQSVSQDELKSILKEVTQIESLVLNTKKKTAEPAAKQERVPHQSATARLASTAARPTATEQLSVQSSGCLQRTSADLIGGKCVELASFLSTHRSSFPAPDVNYRYTQPGECKDDDGWATSDGKNTCKTYESNGWCTNGTIGPNWHSDWTWEQGNNDKNAWGSCCACGKRAGSECSAIYHVKGGCDCSWANEQACGTNDGTTCNRACCCVFREKPKPAGPATHRGHTSAHTQNVTLQCPTWNVKATSDKCAGKMPCIWDAYEEYRSLSIVRRCGRALIFRPSTAGFGNRIAYAQLVAAMAVAKGMLFFFDWQYPIPWWRQLWWSDALSWDLTMAQQIYPELLHKSYGHLWMKPDDRVDPGLVASTLASHRHVVMEGWAAEFTIQDDDFQLLNKTMHRDIGNLLLAVQYQHTSWGQDLPFLLGASLSQVSPFAKELAAPVLAQMAEGINAHKQVCVWLRLAIQPRLSFLEPFFLPGSYKRGVDIRKVACNLARAAQSYSEFPVFVATDDDQIDCPDNGQFKVIMSPYRPMHSGCDHGWNQGKRDGMRLDDALTHMADIHAMAQCDVVIRDAGSTMHSAALAVQLRQNKPVNIVTLGKHATDKPHVYWSGTDQSITHERLQSLADTIASVLPNAAGGPPMLRGDAVKENVWMEQHAEKHPFG